MGRFRVIILLMLATPAILGSAGCAGLRLPAIDPTGRRLFLPSPNYTSLARDGFLSRLHGRRLNNSFGGAQSLPGIGQPGFAQPGFAQPGITGGNGQFNPLPGPYEPALFNRHREGFGRLLRHEGSQFGPTVRDGFSRLVNGIHGRTRGLFQHHRNNNPLFANSAFPGAPNPPLCGPNGLAPDGSPCYPLGSPSPSSIAMTIPGSSNLVGSGLSPNCKTGTCGNMLSSSQSSMARFAQLGSGVVLAQPRYTARVGEEVVILGGVQSTSGIAQPREALKWSLSNDSVGTIIDASSGPQKRRRLFSFLHRASASPSNSGCGSCVHSVTSDRCKVITRNPVDPRDDIYLSKGQSWVSVTSGSPGRSFVTLAAPQLQQGRRVATAIIDWTDATWKCPAPVVSSLERAQLITSVFRNSDQQPIPNWLVRYNYIDGPKVTLNDSGTTAEVASDARGRAILNLTPEGTEQGTTRIAIQIFDPEVPAQPVGQCLGYVTWSESEPAGQAFEYPEEPTTTPGPPPGAVIGPPEFGDLGPRTPSPSPEEPFRPSTPEPDPQPRNTNLAIQVNGLRRATVGSLARYEVLVRNIGNTAAERVTLSTIEQVNGLRYYNSSLVPERDESGLLAWDLGRIAPGDTKPIRVEYEVVDGGNRVATVEYQVAADNAEKRQNRAQTQLAGDLIEVVVSDSQPDSPVVGSVFRHDVRVNNRSRELVEMELIVKDWSDGIRPIARGNERANPASGLSKRITVRSGPSQGMPIEFESLAPGNHRFVVVAQPMDPNLKPAQAEGFVTVRGQRPDIGGGTGAGGGFYTSQPRIEADVAQQTMDANSENTVRFMIANTTNQTLTNMKVYYVGDQDLVPTSNSNPGFQQVERNGVQGLLWAVDDMKPGYQQTIEVGLRSAEVLSRRGALHNIIVESDQGTFTLPVEIGFNPPRSGAAPTIHRAAAMSGIRLRTAKNRFAGARALTAPSMPVALQPTRIGSQSRDIADKDLTAKITMVPALAQADEPVEFVVRVTNHGESGYRNVALSLDIDSKFNVEHHNGPPMVRSKLSSNDEGQSVNFVSVREILPGETLTYRVNGSASASGQIVGSIEASGLSSPVVVTNNYQVR